MWGLGGLGSCESWGTSPCEGSTLVVVEKAHVEMGSDRSDRTLSPNEDDTDSMAISSSLSGPQRYYLTEPGRSSVDLAPAGRRTCRLANYRSTHTLHRIGRRPLSCTPCSAYPKPDWPCVLAGCELPSIAMIQNVSMKVRSELSKVLMWLHVARVHVGP